MKNTLLAILALVQIIVWCILLSRSIFTNTYADITFTDGHTEKQWYQSGPNKEYSQAKIATSPNAPIEPPVVTTFITNRDSH